jgi:hypothetical protein
MKIQVYIIIVNIVIKSFDILNCVICHQNLYCNNNIVLYNPTINKIYKLELNEIILSKLN